jgi:hypothetical protein
MSAELGNMVTMSATELAAALERLEYERLLDDLRRVAGTKPQPGGAAQPDHLARAVA